MSYRWSAYVTHKTPESGSSMSLFRFRYYAEGTAVVWNHFFGNNSNKPEPIGTKFYRETSTQVARSTANFWCPPPNGRKTDFMNFCVTKIRVVSPTSWKPIFVKFGHKTWIGVIINLFGA